MTYNEAKQAREVIEAEIKSHRTVLSTFPKGPMNLTPDAVKAIPEYQLAKRGVEGTFARLQKFNTIFVKLYADEIRAERRAK